ncbi:MAG TPA: methyltransferase domain-containing protein [Croceibacterium sp.]
MGFLSLFPERVQYPLIVLKRLGGTRPRTCPICGYHGKFRASGQPPRYDSVCGGCGSRERHRLFMMAVTSLNLIHQSDSIIHFAPERVLRVQFEHRAEYKTADIVPGRAQLVLDLEALALGDESVDVAIVNHVLEHVDDRKAFAELFRVLKPGGRLIAMVPLIEGWPHSYENHLVTSERDRSDHFGQGDHVRYYGGDFRTRLEGAGFELSEFVASGEEVVKHGLIRGERVFVGTKPR